MEDHSKFQQMQDEMSRFEAEISGPEPGLMRPVIAAATYGVVQQQLERGPMVQFENLQQHQLQQQQLQQQQLQQQQLQQQQLQQQASMANMMFPSLPPPPPPPQGIMVPAQVQRMRPPPAPPMLSQEEYHQPLSFLRPGLPGPQLIPPPPAPPKPQPVILSAAPKLYKQPEDKKEKRDKESRKRRRSPPPPAPEQAREPTPPPAPPPPVISHAHDAPKPKREKKNRKVVRTAGGQVWEDVTLLDWPDDDFRMFCGDLGNDVTDELLLRTFSKYTSFQRAKVIRDKRTNKSKGFGFVSFKDPGDFIKAMKEMDGRYVGSRPIKLRKSTWKNRSLDIVRKKEKEKAALLSLLMTGNKS